METPTAAPQIYTYRSPRFAIELPLELVVDGGVVHGISRNLSEEGLLVQLGGPVLPGTPGRLRLQIEACTVEIAVEVAFAEMHTAGLRFCFHSPEERAFISMVLKVSSRTLRATEPRRVALRS